jgi:hypothetical protein
MHTDTCMQRRRRAQLTVGSAVGERIFAFMLSTTELTTSDAVILGIGW